jgi:dUTP pyrophosphatase
MGTAIWDAGYVGRSECSLVVKNPYGFRVKKNARIVQLMFTRLETEVKDGYSGRYMHENM